MIRKSIAIMVILAVMGALLACAGAAEEVSPKLVISPASAENSAPVTILGAGFVPGEKVEVAVTVEGVAVALGGPTTPGGDMGAVANEEGAFMISTKLPHGNLFPPGVHIAKATGDKGSVATFPINIEEKK